MLTLAGTVTHHQKTVLVDYELPESAVGFVMGHNMLDEYWDTDKHSALFRPGNNMDPRLGANGKLPRQDISSRVTGPILEHLHGFVNGMVASHLLCHSGTINRHSLNGALLS
ncbi:hypothetical protein [Klebsiella pneumoniae]|uniref:hypothetical protein n=2 Tax=Klebsiella/Raoultella group TaxID=2890311 RepID=UPI001F4F3D55|nr:hypothetical protein [Klebsiella pneumoniae]